MSQSGISRWIVMVLLAFCLAITGAFCDNAMAAEKNTGADKPKADIRTKIAEQAAAELKKAANAKVETVTNKTMPAVNKSETAPKPSGVTAITSNKNGITDVRWSTATDAITGQTTFRMVLDTSLTVKVQDELNDGLPPRLSVIVKGVKPGDLQNKTINFDGKVAVKATFSAEGKNDTKIVFDLAAVVEKDDYKVFTLKKNIEPGKPFRVVIDIGKPVPLPSFSFTPGLKDKVIVIDPGHGGTDSGAVGPNKTNEKNVTLAVSKLVKELLEKEDAKVVLTRSTDRDVAAVGASDVEELGARVNVANYRKADVFISIHADSFTNRTAGGTSTYYHQKTVYDVMLAKTLQNRLLQAGKLQDRRANSSNFYVVKNTRMPAALVELAFISNPNEERLLNSLEFQKKMAKGIVDGIRDFFDQAAKLGGGA